MSKGKSQTTEVASKVVEQKEVAPPVLKPRLTDVIEIVATHKECGRSEFLDYNGVRIRPTLRFYMNLADFLYYASREVGISTHRSLKLGDWKLSDVATKDVEHTDKEGLFYDVTFNVAEPPTRGRKAGESVPVEQRARKLIETADTTQLAEIEKFLVAKRAELAAKAAAQIAADVKAANEPHQSTANIPSAK